MPNKPPNMGATFGLLPLRFSAFLCQAAAVACQAATLWVSLACGAAVAGDPSAFTDDDRSFWLWQPCLRSDIPQVAGAGDHPIDAFLLERLRAATIAPAPAADRRTLIRRATFDLHGLPPTPAEVAEFLADESPDAYERLIDRLLASPRYGEHWARHWLDLARYAESDGFKSDDLRPNAWRYRDYVIEAFNQDLPFDQFIVEQLAGDEAAPDEPRALVATGFLRLGPYEENGRDVADQRCNILNDITDVTGQVFLGLTIGCARCHDHKYDPILQADYFRLQAFFAALTCADDEPLARPAERIAYDERLRAWESATAAARQQIELLERPLREQVLGEKRRYFPEYVQDILDMPAERRTPLELQMASLAERQLVVGPNDFLKQMNAEDHKQYVALRKEIKESGGGPPAPLPRAMMARDIGCKASSTTIPGDGEPIEPGFLAVLSPQPPQIKPVGTESTGRRLALARWIADPQNPLTPRVTVNRIWQQHFGRGLVPSSGDLGRQGDRPTHPQLLDWLATEWIAKGFRLKPLHRLIMTSMAYQRTSDGSAESVARDPDNALLGRFSRRRLSAEQLRDALLATSGELNLQAGGPSVRTELPERINSAYAWKPDPDPAQRNRRSIYLLVRRNLREPLLEVFDMPDTHESCTRRFETTTAPQALFLLNSRWSADRARALAERVASQAGTDSAAAIRHVFELAYQRTPDAEELASAMRFLERPREPAVTAAQADQSGAPDAPNDAPESSITATPWGAALVDFCHVLLNSNEYVYPD